MLDQLLGQVIEEKYQVEKQLGAGGMGAVFMATHLGTGRPVALKVISPQLMSNEEFVERFKREAKAAGLLRHPNVVNVTDFGFTKIANMRIAYLVMEFLNGHNLGDLLRRQPQLPISLILDITEQVCLAVEEAHSQGIIHRDLKPDNIWLEPNGRGGFNVKVLDFGLAKLRNQEDAEEDADLIAANPDINVVNGRVTITSPAVKHTNVDISAITSVQIATSKDSTPTRLNPSINQDEEQTGIQIPINKTPVNQVSINQIAINQDEEKTNVQTPADPDADRTKFQVSRATFTDERRQRGELTTVGSILGTPLYMSPEQCCGAPLNTRSDIYSLGIIIYQMCVGKTPFQGDMNTLIFRHTQQAPPPIREVRRSIPAPMESLIMMALAKEPSQRPRSARDLFLALRAANQTEADIIRQSRYYYSVLSGKFYLLSLMIYLPSAIFSLAITYLLSSRGKEHPKLTIILSLIILSAIILFVNQINTAFVAPFVEKILTTSHSSIKLKPLLKNNIKRFPLLLYTIILDKLNIAINLLKLVLPGIRTAIDHSLVPTIVMLEDKQGFDALIRSKKLLQPINSLATNLYLREIVTSMFSVLLFPSVMVLPLLLFGAPLSAIVPVLYNCLYVNALSSWFMLSLSHTPQSAVATTLLYFQAKQINSEHFKKEYKDELKIDLKQEIQPTLHITTKGWLVGNIICVSILSFVMFIFPIIKFDNTSFITVVASGNYQKVKDSIANNKNINKLGFDGKNPLMVASEKGYEKIVELLITAGADVNYKDNDGDTAIMYAAVQGHLNCAKRLIDAGADINIYGINKMSALIYAVRYGHSDVATLLLKSGADINIVDKEGKTAMQYAQEYGHQDIIQLLQSYRK